MKKIMEFISTGFYSGKLPMMPGTWGSILATILALIYWPKNWSVELLLICATFVISVISSDITSKALNDRDPDCVVIDEILGMEITFFLIKVDIWTALIGLILFRIIDIIKPPPINFLERLPGGWGITADDMLAGVFANLILRLIWRLI